MDFPNPFSGILDALRFFTNASSSERAGVVVYKLLPCGRDKTGAPSVVLNPPSFTTTTQPTPKFYDGTVAV